MFVIQPVGRRRLQQCVYIHRCSQTDTSTASTVCSLSRSRPKYEKILPFSDVSPSRVSSISPVSARVGASTLSSRITFASVVVTVTHLPRIRDRVGCCYISRLSSGRVLKIHHLDLQSTACQSLLYTSASRESIVIDYRFRLHAQTRRV